MLINSMLNYNLTQHATAKQSDNKNESAITDFAELRGVLTFVRSLTTRRRKKERIDFYEDKNYG